MRSTLRIGIIAAEFPPEVGGMQIMALHLAIHLAQSHHVIVCTTQATRSPYEGFQVLTNLRGRTEDDVAALNRVSVDVWLAMNAGYAAVAAKLSKPLVAYFHGNDFLNPWVVSTPLIQKLLSKLPLTKRTWSNRRREYARAQIGAGIKSTRRILTNSSHTKDLIHQYFPQYQEVFVCNPGVEDKFFQIRAESGGGSPVLRLLTVCRLQKASRRKNISGVLEALASIKQQLNFTYSIVGDGDDLKSLCELRDRFGLTHQVNFRGRVSDHDLLDLYRHADLFVLPVKASAVDVEGFGIVYLEANAAGVPVLCSATGGATDAVIDGQTGIVVPSADPDQIAEGILQFAQSRANYGADQLRQFASGFTWEIAAARIEDQILISLESVERPVDGLLDSRGTMQSSPRINNLFYDSSIRS